jgi:hypothetical protein
VMDNPPMAEKQIIKLPEDGNAYFTSIFVPANWQNDSKSRELVAWFESHDQLRSLKAQTHFKVFAANDPMSQRYRNVVTELPCVMIQKPDGTRVYHRQGAAVPTSPNGLAADIQGQLYSNCPWRKPDEPPPDDEPVVDKSGPPTLANGPAGFEPNVVLAVLALVAGLGLGVGTSYYEQYYGEIELV